MHPRLSRTLWKVSSSLKEGEERRDSNGVFDVE
jgi:hypothetical protein